MEFNRAIRALSHPIARWLFRPLMRNRATIFMLHRLSAPSYGIGGHSLEFITSALHELRESGARFVSVRSLIERWSAGHEVGPNEVAFTLDDGFADQAEIVRRAFIPAECPATIFLITGFLDGKLWPWDDQLNFIFKSSPVSSLTTVKLGEQQLCIDLSSPEARHKSLEYLRECCKRNSNEKLYFHLAELATQLNVVLPSQPPPEYRPIDWDEARDLARQGIDFGPHSMTHRIFSRLSPQEARDEIAGSWARLQQELANPLPVFAWPTGRYNDFETKDIELAQQIGLKASVATNDDYSYVSFSDRNDLFRIKRFALPTSTPGVLRYGSWIERGRQMLPV